MTRPQWRQQLEALLEEAKEDPTARFAQLATVTQDCAPANRTVVVRGFMPDKDALIIGTDSRSDKIEHLRHPTGAAPEVSLCWYVVEARHQFRIRGTVAVIDADCDAPSLVELRERIWSRLGRGTQRSFFGPPPGSRRRASDETTIVLSDGSPADVSRNFALLVLPAETVDHLALNPLPHRRTRHERQRDDEWRTTEINA